MPVPMGDTAGIQRKGSKYTIAVGDAAIQWINGTAVHAVDEYHGLLVRGSWRDLPPPQSQTALNTSVPLVPPNPNEFEMATAIFISRAVFGT